MDVSINILIIMMQSIQVINFAVAGDVNKLAQICSRMSPVDRDYHLSFALFNGIVHEKINIIEYCLRFNISYMDKYNALSHAMRCGKNLLIIKPLIESNIPKSDLINLARYYQRDDVINIILKRYAKL